VIAKVTSLLDQGPNKQPLVRIMRGGDLSVGPYERSSSTSLCYRACGSNAATRPSSFSNHVIDRSAFGQFPMKPVPQRSRLVAVISVASSVHHSSPLFSSMDSTAVQARALTVQLTAIRDLPGVQIQSNLITSSLGFLSTVCSLVVDILKDIADSIAQNACCRLMSSRYM
jgi:hypothetical protein